MTKLTPKMVDLLKRTPPDVPRVAFAAAGCVLHRTHAPTPASSELHHVFPLYLQARKFDDVDPNKPATAHDKERVPVCGTGHSDVHLAIDDMLAGRARRAGVGRTEQELALTAIARFGDV